MVYNVYRLSCSYLRMLSSRSDTANNGSQLARCDVVPAGRLASKQLDLSHRRTVGVASVQTDKLVRSSLISHVRQLTSLAPTFSPRTTPKTTVAYVCPRRGLVTGGHVSGKGANAQYRRRRRPGLRLETPATEY